MARRFTVQQEAIKTGVLGQPSADLTRRDGEGHAHPPLGALTTGSRNLSETASRSRADWP